MKWTKRCRTCKDNDPTVAYRDGALMLLCAACNEDAKRRAEAEPTPLTAAVGDLVRFSPAALRVMAS